MEHQKVAQWQVLRRQNREVTTQSLPNSTSQGRSGSHASISNRGWRWGAEAQVRMSDLREGTNFGCPEDALRKLVQEMGESREKNNNNNNKKKQNKTKLGVQREKKSLSPRTL